MTTPGELHARAAELEARVPPLTAGPHTDDERMLLEKAAALRNEAGRTEATSDPSAAAADYIPGSAGSLLKRVTEVIENEVPSAYTRLATMRAGEAIGAWQHAAIEQARTQARTVFAGLMPGATGINRADEVADKILAAIGLLPPS